MGYVKEKETGKADFIVNPGMVESELSELDLIVTSLKGKTLMLEAGAQQVSEDLMVEAIKKAQIENDKSLIL